MMKRKTKFLITFGALSGIVVCITPLLVACGNNSHQPTSDPALKTPPKPKSPLVPNSSGNGNSSVISDTNFNELGQLVEQYLALTVLKQTTWFTSLPSSFTAQMIATAFQKLNLKASDPYTQYPVGWVPNPYQNWITVLETNSDATIQNYVQKVLWPNNKLEIVPFILYETLWNADYKQQLSRFAGTYFLPFSHNPWLMSEATLTKILNGDLENFSQNGAFGIPLKEADQLVKTMQVTVINENTFTVNGFTFYAQNAITNVTLLKSANASFVNDWITAPEDDGSRGVYNSDGQGSLFFTLQGIVNYFNQSTVKSLANAKHYVLQQPSTYQSLVTYADSATNNYQVQVSLLGNFPFAMYNPNQQTFELMWNFNLYLLSQSGPGVQVISDSQMAQSFTLKTSLPLSDF